MLDEPIQVFSFDHCDLQLEAKGQWAREGGTTHLITSKLFLRLIKL